MSLSRDDLLLSPELVQPLGTHKGVRNKPTEIHVDLNALFLFEGNETLLHTSLLKVYRQNGGHAPAKKVRAFISKLMRKFAKSRDLNDYVSIEAQATGYSNYAECLRAINNDFTHEFYKYMPWNAYNPVREKIEVGPTEFRVLKKGYELRPEDYGTLDLWREQVVQLRDSVYRDGNKIPFYQATVCSRHYDKSNEGLRCGSADRASLETPVYGYDMTQIYKQLDKWKSDDWFSM
jgi:hypothetical protein